MSQNINLYDASLRTRRDPLGASAALVLVFATIAGVLVAAGTARWLLAGAAALAADSSQASQDQQATLDALSAQAAMPADSSLQARIAATQRTLLLHRSALQTLVAPGADHDGGFSPRLLAFARRSVDGLWLTGVNLGKDSMLLKGRALSPSLIPVFVQGLDQESALRGHAFKALDVKRPVETGTGNAAPAAADGHAPNDSAQATRAAFVEFTLVGMGSGAGMPPAAVAREARP